MGRNKYLLGAVVLTLYAMAESCGFRTFKYRATCVVNGPTRVSLCATGLEAGNGGLAGMAGLLTIELELFGGV